MGVDLIVLGDIIGVHGVRGEIKVKTYSGTVKNLVAARDLVIAGAEPVTVKVVSARIHKGVALVKLEGVERVDQARSLVGKPLLAPRSQLVPAGPGEYYVFDLIGLRVQSTEGESLGEVVNVQAMPANDLIVISHPTCGEFYVPAVRDIVRRIDLDARVMIIDDRPGLRDRGK